MAKTIFYERAQRVSKKLFCHSKIKFISSRHRVISSIYYMEESVLLGTKPLVDSIRHFIRDPSGVFSVCHLCECRIVQWRHDSRLLLLLNWLLHIIKRALHVGSKIRILCSRGKVILKTAELPSLVWCRSFYSSAICSSFRHVSIRVYIYNIVQSSK